MGLKRNVGMIDRIFRAAFGTAFVAYGLLYLVGLPLIVVLIVGLVLLVTAFTGSCFVYSLFGISTCGSKFCDIEEAPPPMEEEMMSVEIDEPVMPVKKKRRRKRRKKR